MSRFRLNNVWIILGALGLNLLFFLTLVSMNRTLEPKDVQDKLNVIEVWQIQPKEPKTHNRKKSKERPVEKIKKKKMRLKTVSLNQEKMRPRKTRRILNIDVQPSLNISDADLAFQADYFSEAIPKDRHILELDEVDQPPWKVHHVQPPYPYYARVKRIEGDVTLQFLVDEKGNVSNVQILDVYGFDGFGASAKEAVLKWRFKLQHTSESLWQYGASRKSLLT